jgi:KaiC/GvpD/RAD55 family RecA-like ATPase
MEKQDVINEVKDNILKIHNTFSNFNEDTPVSFIEKAIEEIKNKFNKISIKEVKSHWNNILVPLIPDDAISLKTGYERFDKWNAIRKKRITCFIGKIGGLKTKSLINIAVGLTKCGYRVAYISFEVEQGELQRQILCQLFNIKRYDLEKLKYEEILSLWNEKYNKCKSPELFYDSYQTYNSGQLLSEILSKETDDNKFDAIIVDYLSIIDSPLEDMYSKGKKISQDFAAFAKSYNWSIITAAQTNRNGLTKIINTVDDIAESTGLLHTFDFIISIIHYKRLIRSRECLWHLLKARYVSNGNSVGSKATFSINWESEGIFTEIENKRHKEIIKIVDKDDLSGNFGKFDDEEEIKVEEYDPNKDSLTITGKKIF